MTPEVGHTPRYQSLSSDSDSGSDSDSERGERRPGRGGPAARADVTSLGARVKAAPAP